MLSQTAARLQAVSPNKRSNMKGETPFKAKKVTMTVLPKNVIHENPMEVDLETSNSLLAKHTAF